MLDILFELFLELIQEGCFYLIRKYVKNRFLRGILYVLTLLIVVALGFAIVIGAIWLGLSAIETVLDWLLSLLQ